MGVLFFALGAGILAYLAFVFFFPKSVQEEGFVYRRQMLDQLYGETQSNMGDSAAAQQRSVLRGQLDEQSALAQLFFRPPFMQPMYQLTNQAGFANNPGAVVIIFIVLTALIAFLAIKIMPAAVLLSPVGAFFLLRFYLKSKVQKRNRKFLNYFPDVLDMMVRSVRSGFPVATAFKMVADNMEPPVSTEFQQMIDEIAAGRSVSDALARLVERVNEPDIQFFVVVLNVQQETGGNLAEVLSNLSGIIRKRKQLRLKIHAITSEGRATSYVLSALPVFIFAVLFYLDREYLEPLWKEPSGRIILYIVGGLLVTCQLVVRRMINIDV